MFGKSRQEDEKFKVYPGLKEERERWKGKEGRSDGYRISPHVPGNSDFFLFLKGWYLGQMTGTG